MINKINKYIEDIKEKIKDFLYNKIKIPIMVFIESIESILFWFPIIWKDRDWDSIYLLKLIEIKIRKMRKYFIESGVAIHSKKEIRAMVIAETIVKRLKKEGYDKYLSKKHDEKWGKLEVFLAPCEKNLSSYSVYRGKIFTDKDRKQEYKENKQIMEHEEYMTNQDLELLGKTFKKHLKKWWD